MIAANENKVLSMILIHEGGFSNHPKDPGGATMKGVTQRTYDAYRKNRNLSLRSVKNMTGDEMNAIYDQQYWDVIKGDSLPSGVDYVVMDGAVNSGNTQSVKWLQRSLQPLYKGSVDGIVGAQTLQAIEAFGDDDTLIDRICDRRMAFLKALKTWRTFGKGWSARVADVRSVGKAWASGRTPVSVSFIEGAQTKALVEDAKQPTTKGVADAATGGGIGAGALAGTLQNLQDQLTPFSSSSTWISNVVVALAIGGTALAVGGIGYRWYAQRRDARLADALNMGA